MHAVVVRVTIRDVERAQQALEGEIVPQVSSLPGFKAGYWTRVTDGGETNGLSMVIFDAEENAQAAADRVRGMAAETTAAETVTIESVEVREVVASA
jgi:hypothetical protein